VKWNRRPIEDIRIMDRLFAGTEAETAALGDAEPGPEHLVLSALELPEGSARRAFERLGADPDGFRTSLAELRGVAPCPDPPEPTRSRHPVRLGPRGRDLFPRVVELVRADKSRIYGAYVLLVAANMGDGTIEQVLERMHVEPQALAAAARAEVDRLNGPGA